MMNPAWLFAQAPRGRLELEGTSVQMVHEIARPLHLFIVTGIASTANLAALE
jgi:hypothetical protein